MRLTEQYLLLYRRFAHQSGTPDVATLCACLNCSDRYLRTRLRQMQQAGWLEWQPGRGRGRRSSWRFLCSEADLLFTEWQQQIDAGQLEQVLNSLSGAWKQRLQARLPDMLGMRAAGRALRVGLYRRPTTLDPLYTSSRLEAHLVRLLFDRLCDFDPRTAALQPGLAHAWHANADGRTWRFWLRPGLRFHDGTVLDAAAVITSLRRLQLPAHPFAGLYAHLGQLSLHDPLSFSCQLADTDWFWPNRLATASASVVPVRRNSTFGREPIGSGPFQLSLHSSVRLALQANEFYFRERPLLDQLEFWFLSAENGPANWDLHLGAADAVQQQVQQGCSYLQFHPRRLTHAARMGLWHALAAPALVTPDDKMRMAASALRPGWTSAGRPEAGQLPAAGRTLTLAHYDLPVFVPLAQAIARRLNALGLTVETMALDYPAFAAGAALQADLVLASEVLHEDLDYGCFEWWGGNASFRAMLDGTVRTELDRRLAKLQCQPSASQRTADCQRLGAWLVASGALLPLAHERVAVFSAPDLAGIQTGSNGWPDFSRVWWQQP